MAGAVAMDAAWPPGIIKPPPKRRRIFIVHDDSDVELAISPKSRAEASSAASSSSGAPKTRKGPFEAAVLDVKAKAVTLLQEALGGGPERLQLANDIKKAFFESPMLVANAISAYGDNAHRVRALISALRVNAPLRERVIKGGRATTLELAQEDPRKWATESVQARRQEWAASAMATASQGPTLEQRPCPQCGGRAYLETGTYPAFKMAKAFAHYKCLEKNCGKETHERE
mmetsp:Transcript_57862/g.123044  ORF Transcript_57862/g.123044 Transcript_57862/m.123044 type:complete len:230 (-) Transcript_57862:157-846(-)|eukprot:CAMPEP_0206469278 /NCGR_PEP_ID=MMETSP0324_2-20121206/30175_1 /ASSEMBLY_ACC=CAM_ASM_000836 /TAXON_ID=2866 /ORGANISM="Crypthecodinium cohnii, Strain Seligo" /LENGTH=229 /DNA_ID=CAMNT_0053942987 /DNA_START=83 /DNA_END=772 /DNA_ORIENTATION=-